MSGAGLPAIVERRLHELVQLYDLHVRAAEQLAAVLRLLRNDPLAPTTVRDPVAAVDEHIADSLVALELHEVICARLIADLGSGAGFPGLPLAIALPDSAVSLVESNGRKCAFLRHAAEISPSANISVVNARVEEWGSVLGTLDLVTARAVAPPAVIAEYAAPLLRLGGSVVMWRGRPDPEAQRDAEAAADRLGLTVVSLRQVHPFIGAERRYLYLMSKVTETPSEYPRRPGMARKRPLRATDRAP